MAVPGPHELTGLTWPAPGGAVRGRWCTPGLAFGMMKGHEAGGRCPSPATWRSAVPEEVTMHQPPIPHVESADRQIADLIHAEARRQFEKIRLIPSENYVSTAVLEADRKSVCRERV